MKRVLSVLLAAVLLLGSLSAGTSALAAQAKSVTVTVSVYDAGFTMKPQSLTVSADLSDTYAASIGCNDEGSEPTILDAFVAASIKLYGKKFTKKAPLTITESYGWKMINAAFGKDYPALAYYHNNASAGGVDEQLADGDVLEIDFYQNADWSDKYVWFDAQSTTVASGDYVTLYATQTYYDSSWNLVTEPAAGLSVTLDGKAAATTDKNGKAKVRVIGVGEHLIAATAKNDTVFAPWCVVTVSELTTYVKKEMRSAAKYLTRDIKAFTCDDAVDYLTYLRSNYTVSAYSEGFVNSVKSNLKKNNGKLISGYTGKEDIGMYGAVISALRLLGYSPAKFNGYNLIAAFESVDLSEAVSNPYYYRVAIEAASETFGKKLCDDMVSRYYTMGKGMNYWGYSCDNTAYFLTAIAKYKSSYKTVVADAKKVLKSYTKSNGAYADDLYVTEVNPDSTALAMMAYSALGDAKTAFKYYRWLVQGFEGRTGVFRYDGKYNAYATKDCLLALEYFKKAANAQGFEHTQDVVKTTLTKAQPGQNGSIVKYCAVCGKRVSKTVIYRPKKSISIAKSTYRYTGKAITPKVKLYDSKGNLISSKYYTVKYSNNKKVGTAKITVTFKGNYSGKLTKTFKIVKK